MKRFLAGLRRAVADRVPALRPEHPAYPWLVMAAVASASIMSILDSTVVNVAVAKFQVSFGASTDAVQWVITGYLLAYAITLTATPRLADRFGYKRVFLAAIALFTFGSFLCSLSWSLPSLVFFRIVQGVGGGLMAPIASAYVRRAFPKEKLGLALGVFSIPTLVVTSFGPSIGGMMIDGYAWQLIFSINIPIGIAGMAVAYVVLREYREGTDASFDLAGFAAIALALGALLLGLSDGNADWNADGWRSPFILGCFAASALGFVAFFALELRSRHPLVELSLFGNYNYGLGSFVLFVFGLGIFGADFLLPLYLQAGLGYTPTQAGLMFIPYGLVMAATSILGGRLTDKLGPKIPGLAGLLIRALGLYRFVFLSPYSSGGDIAATVIILAVGMGLLMSPIQTTVFASVPVEKAAQGSGLMQVVRQLGGSFGVAMLSTVLIQRESLHAVMAGQSMDSSSPVLRELAASALTRAMHDAGATAIAASSAGMSIVSETIRNRAFIGSIDDAFFVALAVSLVSSVPFLFLRSPPKRAARAKAPDPAAK